ncbi:MAG TPA: LURP-one-related family protein [Ruminococcus sp.]|nr:LURP-one-related family protein [Ruminococcus sp.]
MGFFDFSGGGNMGFGSVKNVQNFTNEQLFEKLSAIKVSFGTPIMGDIFGTQSVMYKKATTYYDIFVRVHKDKIIMGKIGTDGTNSVGTAMQMESEVLLGSKDEESSYADRAVDELLEVIKKLENGEYITITDEAMPANTATGEPISLYMEQKLFSLKPRFDVFDQEKNVVFHVEGDITSHSFTIQQDGREVLKLKRKIAKIMDEYVLIRNDETVAELKKKFRIINPEVSGTVNGAELRIAGDMMGIDYDIKIGGRTVAHVDQDKAHWSDCYRISIKDEDVQDIVIALAVICDHVSDKDSTWRH